MNANPDYAKSKLEAASLAKSRAKTASWVALIMGLLLLAILGVALADYQWLLPQWARLTGFIMLILLVLAGLGRMVWLLRRPATIKEAALDAEAQDNQLGCTVSTAAEYLSGERQIQHEYEPKLVAALESQAGELLSTVKLPYWRSLVGPGLLCLAGTLVFTLFLLGASGSLTALRRAATPWTTAAYTQIEIKPGDAEIPVGKGFEITAIFHGRVPAEAILRWRENPTNLWQSTPLSKNTNGAYVGQFKEVRKDFYYRVEGGGAASREGHVTVYEPAAIKELALRLDYPAYTGLKPALQKSPDITALRGSTATFTLVANVPLSQAKLVSDKTPGIALTGASNRWSGTLTLTTNTSYHLELWDAKSRPGLAGTTNHIKVLPDMPPKVEIAEPGQDMRANSTNAIVIKATASDDFGVADVKLVYHKLGGPDLSLPLVRAGEKGRELTATNVFDLSAIALKPFDVIAYWAEARDKNTLDGPGIGRSPVYFIEINDSEGSPSPKGKPQPPTAKLNLLVIQKQIIADTRALAPNAAPVKYTDLATRENDAAGFAQLYLDSMVSNGAPAEATALMRSAMLDLTNATSALQVSNRTTALPPEERALASFYQILKLLPELQNMPVQQPPTNAMAQAKTNQPPSKMLKVVLEAIGKQSTNQPNVNELEELLEQTQQLSQAQNSINHLTAANKKQQAKAGGNVSGRQVKSDAEAQESDSPESAKNEGDSPSEDSESASENPDNMASGKGQMAKANQPKSGPGKSNQQTKAGQGQGKEAGDSADKPEDSKDENAQNDAENKAEQDAQAAKEGQNGKDSQLAKNGQKGQKGKQGQQGKNGQGKQGQKGKGKGKGKGQGQGQGQGEGEGQGAEGKNGKGQGTKPGANKQPNNQAPDGQKPEGQKKNSDPQVEPEESKDELAKKMDDAAEQEEELSKESAELAEKIERAAGKDTRLGHGISKAIQNAAASMNSAAQSLKSGDRPGSNLHGSQAVISLNTAAALLQKAIENNGLLGDISNEDYPREYEAAIQDYLKRLSYQE